MKILLFDDHRIFGESLSKLLEDWDAISICHYVSNETEFWNILSSKGGMLFLTVLINGNGGNIQYLEKDGILTATAVLGRKNEDITI